MSYLNSPRRPFHKAAQPPGVAFKVSMPPIPRATFTLHEDEALRLLAPDAGPLLDNRPRRVFDFSARFPRHVLDQVMYGVQQAGLRANAWEFSNENGRPVGTLLELWSGSRCLGYYVSVKGDHR